MKIGLPKITSNNGCVGIRVGSVGRYALEFWFCSPGFTTPPHRHPNQDIKYVHLRGNCTVLKMTYGMSHRAKLKEPRDIGKVFDIRSNEWHGATNYGKGWVIFASFQKYHDTTPSSAAEDFVELPAELLPTFNHLLHG